MAAVQEFWLSEDLLEYLLPMLDIPTSWAFASVNPLALSILSRPLPWRRFLKRSFKPTRMSKLDLRTGMSKQDLENAMIADLLRMAKVKVPQLQDFLDHLQEVFPLLDVEDSRFGEVGVVQIHLGGVSQLISFQGFLILEQVQSKLIVVEEVTMNWLIEPGHYAKALASQISRQEANVKMMEIRKIQSVHGRQSGRNLVENFLSVARKCSSWSLNQLLLEEFDKQDLDESIWSGLAEVSSTGSIGSLCVDAPALGCRELVRRVWLATREYWSISGLGKLPASRLREIELGPDLSGLHTIVWREEGEAGWRRIVGMITEKEEIEKRKRMFSERITRSALR